MGGDGVAIWVRELAWVEGDLRRLAAWRHCEPLNRAVIAAAWRHTKRCLRLWVCGRVDR